MPAKSQKTTETTNEKIVKKTNKKQTTEEPAQTRKANRKQAAAEEPAPKTRKVSKKVVEEETEDNSRKRYFTRIFIGKNEEGNPCLKRNGRYGMKLKGTASMMPKQCASKAFSKYCKILIEDRKKVPRDFHISVIETTQGSAKPMYTYCCNRIDVKENPEDKPHEVPVMLNGEPVLDKNGNPEMKVIKHTYRNRLTHVEADSDIISLLTGVSKRTMTGETKRSRRSKASEEEEAPASKKTRSKKTSEEEAPASTSKKTRSKKTSEEEPAMTKTGRSKKAKVTEIDNEEEEEVVAPKPAPKKTRRAQAAEAN